MENHLPKLRNKAKGMGKMLFKLFRPVVSFELKQPS